MKLTAICIGNTDFAYLQEGTALYDKRLQQHFGLQWSWQVLPNIKNATSLNTEQIKQREGESLLKQFQTGDYIVLLDERGREYTSEEFAENIERWQQMAGYKRLVFVIGGAYGFSQEVYERAQQKLAFSRMTFSHQMIRLFLAEQLYRAYSILHNQPYHHA